MYCPKSIEQIGAVFELTGVSSLSGAFERSYKTPLSFGGHHRFILGNSREMSVAARDKKII